MMAAEEAPLVSKRDGTYEKSHGKDLDAPLSAGDTLGLLLGHAKLSSLEISKLASDRRSYGLAWMILTLFKKVSLHGSACMARVGLVLEDRNSSSLFHPEKTALLLTSLPETTKKLSFPGENAQFLEFLPANALAFLHSLVVKDVLCAADSRGMLHLTFWMSWCDLKGLQQLQVNMGGRGPREAADASVQALASGLTKSVVPQLRVFELYGRACGEKGTRAVLTALKSEEEEEERPPVEELRMHVIGMAQQEADAICSGRVPFLKGLQVMDSAIKTFLDALMQREGVVGLTAPFFELSILLGNNYIVLDHSALTSRMTECLLANKLGCLRRFVYDLPYGGRFFASDPWSRVFDDAFRTARLPHICTLNVHCVNLVVAGLFVGLEGGNFPSLRSLSLRRVSVGSEDMEVLGRAAVAQRLRQLEELDLLEIRRRFGGGELSLVMFTQALGAGQMPHLKRLAVPLSSDCIVALAGVFVLNDLPALKTLEVYSWFREGGLKAFFEGLRPTTLPSLCRFGFRGLGFFRKLSDDDAGALAAALREGRLPALESLSLRGTPSGIDRLRESDWGGRAGVVSLVVDSDDLPGSEASEGSGSLPPSLIGSSLADDEALEEILGLDSEVESLPSLFSLE
uniref:Uncharacterized protein n=1 Tax=Chromera velia CCMP2878 TaxID=1169474 RepID=A0A0G4IFR0_9ALVE|eukprot:Cvel_14114.t1-p1 / transcript=Cvel_14114.t1 / gene=Cvel_14114 / organism=Chromera_velia_CCMP2878 / gene_product=hypothetical protein / transcript_product=hypothetical protein / location=Cvel_scaffold994:10195-13511(+) / protein_length=627 / sequence_SO=supercontig / SO=protein_coding / is_pseudo=false